MKFLIGYKFKVSPNSFFQVNPRQTEVLYNKAIELISKKNNGIALDLYCGIGTIGILASKHFKKVYGIEVVPEAIQDANENKKINSIDNIEFYAGEVEDVLPKLLEKEKIKPDVVFVDPPRRGLDKSTIKVLIDLKPKQLIYISCNPATLARDISDLQEEYEIKDAQPVDMFPFTHHIETICLLKIK